MPGSISTWKYGSTMNGRASQPQVPREVRELAQRVLVVHFDAGDAVIALGERVPAHVEHVEQLVARPLSLLHFREEVAEHAVHQTAGGVGRAEARAHAAFLAINILVAIAQAAGAENTYLERRNAVHRAHIVDSEPFEAFTIL